jgi:pyruvate formate lyase activating enzyme
MRERGIWVEVTTLIIPGLNDDESEVKDIALFVRSLGEEVPWHVSRFHPRYQVQEISPTPVKTIHRALEIGHEAGLKHVYSGNVPGQGGEDTLCGKCGKLLIARRGYSIAANGLKGSECSQCGTTLAGIF